MLSGQDSVYEAQDVFLEDEEIEIWNDGYESPFHQVSDVDDENPENCIMDQVDQEALEQKLDDELET
ncbi:hypothetical protein BGZ94_006812, partial [Podila epigama]